MARPRVFRTLSQKAGKLLRRRSHAPNRPLGDPQPNDSTEIDDSSANGSRPNSPTGIDITALTSPDPSPLSSQTSLASDECLGMCLAEALTPSPSTDPLPQGQSSFFRRLPPEIREQIYIQYWLSAGIDRHVFLQDGDFCFTPCLIEHDDPVDEIQVALRRDFRPNPCVQRHQKWFKRMNSPWCNHWRCEEAFRRASRKQKQRQKQKGGDDAMGDERPLMTCLPLLLSCKRLYQESMPSLKRHTSLTITDKDTAHALLIRRRSPNPSRDGARHPIFAFLPHIQTLNIALRQDGPDFLYMHSASLWSSLSATSLPGLRRISLWLDGWEPVSRRLITQFRDLWASIPPAVARKLTVSFPCGDDGLWAWDEVACRVPGPGAQHPAITVQILPPMIPGFKVVLRGWEDFTANGNGWIVRNSAVGRGGPGPKNLLASTNPFEDLKLYGRGFFDPFYP